MVKSGFSLNYADILLLVIPSFMILILVEKIIPNKFFSIFHGVSIFQYLIHH